MPSTIRSPCIYSRSTQVSDTSAAVFRNQNEPQMKLFHFRCFLSGGRSRLSAWLRRLLSFTTSRQVLIQISLRSYSPDLQTKVQQCHKKQPKPIHKIPIIGSDDLLASMPD